MTFHRSIRQASILLFALFIAACSSGEGDAPAAPDRSVDDTSAPTTASVSTTSVAPDDAAPVESTTTEPNLAPDLGDLAGTLAVRRDDGAIVLIEPDGTERDVIAEAGELHAQPTWSNDGRTLAWGSASASGGTVSITDRESGDRIELDVTPPPFYFSFSPDGAQLASLRPTPRGIELGITEGDTYNVLGFGQPFFFSWNPDGVTMTAAVGGRSYGVIDPSLGEQDVVRDADLAVFQTPAVLDDDLVLLPFAMDSGGFELVALSGSDRTPVASGSGAVSMSVNPVDNRVAILTGPAGEPDVVLASFSAAQDASVELRSRSVTVLTFDGAAITSARRLDVANPIGMQWSPDGRQLLVFEASSGDLVTHYAAADTIRTGPRFTPSNEFAVSYLPFLDQYNHSVSWWSPDSRAVVFSGTIGGEFGVHVDVVDDLLPATRVADGDIAVWSPR